MSNHKQSLMAKARDAYADLTDREQKLLMVMGIVLPLVIVALVVGVFKRSLDDIEAQTRSYENALELVANGAQNYVENNSDGGGGLSERFTEEVLENNDVKLTSFIASKATAAGVSVSSYDSDEQPIGSSTGGDSGPIVVERSVSVDIRSAEHDKLLDFFDEIEASDEPVVLKRVDMRAKRSDAGEVRARVEVSTFERRQQES